jgi:hypothetical protein
VKKEEPESMNNLVIKASILSLFAVSAMALYTESVNAATAVQFVPTKVVPNGTQTLVEELTPEKIATMTPDEFEAALRKEGIEKAIEEDLKEYEVPEYLLKNTYGAQFTKLSEMQRLTNPNACKKAGLTMADVHKDKRVAAVNAHITEGGKIEGIEVGAWGDPHIHVADMRAKGLRTIFSHDFQGKSGKYWHVLKNKHMWVTTLLRSWHGSPATVQNLVLVKSMDKQNREYLVSLSLNNAVSVTQGNRRISVKNSGITSISDTLSIGRDGSTTTFFSPNAAISFTSVGGEYFNSSAVQTGPLEAVAFDGYYGDMMQAIATGDSRAFSAPAPYDTNNEYVSDQPFDPSKQGSYGKAYMADNSGYIPTISKYLAGGFGTTKISQICGTTTDKDVVKGAPTTQGPKDMPTLKPMAVKDVLAH